MSSNHRFHLDIPLPGMTQEQAIEISKKIADIIVFSLKPMGELLEINYRLGNDKDRQKSNYLNINDKGHCSSKKTRVGYGSSPNSNSQQ